NTLGLGGALQTVKPIVNSVTDVIDDVLAPIAGNEFTPNDPNEFDPVDNVVDHVTTNLGGVLSPVVDGLLGGGTTGAIIDTVNTQVDYLTDALNNIL
ncbi:hypothetical protein ABTJ98_19770, partial [Acinetobacter baumannii]